MRAETQVIGRALVVWFGILVLASANGALRTAWLIPWLGETAGRTVSTLILAALVLLMTWLTIGWIRPATPSEALQIGVLWLALTLAFELLAGHYLFRQSWAALLEDYDVTRGRIWLLVLLLVLLGPLWIARIRGLLRG